MSVLRLVADVGSCRVVAITRRSALRAGRLLRMAAGSLLRITAASIASIVDNGELAGLRILHDRASIRMNAPAEAQANPHGDFGVLS